MKSPRSEAGPRLAPAPQARRPRHRRQGRQDRRPRHQGPEGPQHGRRRLRGRPDAAAQRVPKLKGFNNPFRVEYQAINLDVLEATGLDRGHRPRSLHEHGLTHKGALVKVLGRGEITRAVTVKAHALLPVGRGGHHRRRRYRGDPAAAVRATAARRPRATSSPTADRASAVGDRSSTGALGLLSSLRNIFKVPDLRNKILFTLFMIVALPVRRPHPGARHRPHRGQDAARAGEGRAACSAS